MLFFIVTIFLILLFLILLMIILFCSKIKNQNKDNVSADDNKIHFELGILNKILYVKFDCEIHTNEKDNSDTQA